VRSLNFYSSAHHGNILTRKKTCTIRLGDKSGKYQEGDVVLVTYGNRFEPRKELFKAVLDKVEVKPLSALSEQDIKGESPDMRGTDEVVAFLKKIYGRDIGLDETVTVIHFSEITS